MFELKKKFFKYCFFRLLTAFQIASQSTFLGHFTLLLTRFQLIFHYLGFTLKQTSFNYKLKLIERINVWQLACNKTCFIRNSPQKRVNF